MDVFSFGVFPWFPWPWYLASSAREDRSALKAWGADYDRQVEFRNFGYPAAVVQQVTCGR